MKKGLACFLALCALSVGAQAEGANGVYESTAKGFGGDVTVIDRSMLILDIFALHAVTDEGKLQVELA